MEDDLNNEKMPERKRIRLKDFDYSSPLPYHITICSKNKKYLFINDNLNRLIIQCLLKEKGIMGYKIFVYCLMPNHLHLLLSPYNQVVTVSRFIGAFKSKTTRIAWDFGITGQLWQGRFHDHIVRESEALIAIGQYILQNPVRKGLVQKWQDYKYLGLIDNWL